MRRALILLAVVLAGCGRDTQPHPAAVESWQDMLTRELPPDDLRPPTPEPEPIDPEEHDFR